MDERRNDAIPLPPITIQELMRKRMTQEELKALITCAKTDGYIKKTLPAVIGPSALCYFISRSLNATKSMSLILTSVTGMIGYIVGQGLSFTYCLRQTVPHIVEELIQLRKQNQEGLLANPEVLGPANMDQTAPAESYDQSPFSTYDSYTSPIDSHEIEIPSSLESDLTDQGEGKKILSYDDLRKKNREDWQQKNQRYTPVAPPKRPVAREPEFDVTERREAPVRKNKYGDVWE